jgi:hypothetical protein
MNVDEFLEQAKSDPSWLLACLSNPLELDHGGVVRSLLYTYTGILKVHKWPMHPYYMKEQLLQWLIDMRDAGHPVCFNDLGFKTNTEMVKITSCWIDWWTRNYQREAS